MKFHLHKARVCIRLDRDMFSKLKHSGSSVWYISRLFSDGALMENGDLSDRRNSNRDACKRYQW